MSSSVKCCAQLEGTPSTALFLIHTCKQCACCKDGKCLQKVKKIYPPGAGGDKPKKPRKESKPKKSKKAAEAE